MKDIFKGVAIKIISFILVVALLCGCGYLLYDHFVDNKSEHETVNNVEVVKEKLEATAELNTGSYLCTDVLTKSDSKKFKDWKFKRQKDANGSIRRYNGFL